MELVEDKSSKSLLRQIIVCIIHSLQAWLVISNGTMKIHLAGAHLAGQFAFSGTLGASLSFLLANLIYKTFNWHTQTSTDLNDLRECS